MSAISVNSFLWKGGPEKLIREVYMRRPIWDLSSHAHHNREWVARLWEEIADILEAPTDIIKTKWKHLRDNFRTELKKTVKGSRDPLRPYQSQWTYFNDLQFLRDQMMRKISHTHGSGNYNHDLDRMDKTSEDGFLSLAVESEMITEDERLVERHPSYFGHSLFDDNSENNEHFESLTNPENLHLWTQPGSRKRKSSNVEGSQEFLSHYPRTNVMDRVPVTFNYDNSNDDDFHFLMSLLPYVKSLSLPRKMHLRLKLQELICDFIYKVPKNNTNKLQKEKKNDSSSNKNVRVKTERIDQ